MRDIKYSGFKRKAIQYRRQGYSYSMISEKLGLSKSTLSNWLKEIPYKPNSKVLKRIQLAPAKSAEVVHNRKVANIVRTKRLAKKELDKLTKRDLWMLGIGLYLGEGTKMQESTRIINSDPEIIKTAIAWFKKICGLSVKNFTIAIHTYPDNDIKKTISYWSKVTGIPKNQFGKTQIDRRTNKSNKKRRRLPYGTAHLTIKANGKKEFGVNLHRRIEGWIEAALSQINRRE